MVYSLQAIYVFIEAPSISLSTNWLTNSNILVVRACKDSRLSSFELSTAAINGILVGLDEGKPHGSDKYLLKRLIHLAMN